jgi:hypothetical protein
MKIRLEKGTKKDANMTKLHLLPTLAGEAVQQASELVNKAKIALSHLRQADEIDSGDIAEVEVKLADALRWLESCGAQTRPEEL